MEKIKIIIAVLVLCILSSCSRDKSIEELIPKLIEINKIFQGLEGWEEHDRFETSDFQRITMALNNSDTTYIAYFYYYEEQDSVRLETLNKIFKSDTGKHFICMKSDTFYYYVEKDNQLKFIKGINNYKFQKLLLNNHELDLYRDKYDSMSSVEGGVIFK